MGRSPQDRERFIFAIGVFKLVKAGLLIALGVASVMGVAESLIERAAHTVKWVGAFPGRETMHRVLGDLLAVNQRTLRLFGLAALCYAAVFTVEGIGLVRGRRWAEWLTVGVTASFIPLEIYELHHRFGVGKLVALVVNVAIGVYLAWDRLRPAPGALGRTQTSRA